MSWTKTAPPTLCSVDDCNIRCLLYLFIVYFMCVHVHRTNAYTMWHYCLNHNTYLVTSVHSIRRVQLISIRYLRETSLYLATCIMVLHEEKRKNLFMFGTYCDIYVWSIVPTMKSCSILFLYWGQIYHQIDSWMCSRKWHYIHEFLQVHRLMLDFLIGVIDR